MKLLLVRVYRRSPRKKAVGLVIFKGGEVPFLRTIMSSDYHYRTIAKSHSLDYLRGAAEQLKSSYRNL